MAELVAFAEKLADAARPIALRYFRNPVEIEYKADASPVTIADREVEAAMREMIAGRFPGHGLLGEEHGGENIEGSAVWILDPIDGTKSFITGMPTFGTLIAFLDRGRPAIGVIDMPAMGERWLGVSGSATTMNGTPCKTRDCRSLGQANLYTTSIDMFCGAERRAFDAVSAAAAMRRFGGDCYCYGLLASGFVDAVMEASLQPYDYFSLIPVVEGAGGVITDWRGAPLDVNSAGHVVAAATPDLHAEILSTIASG
jgi:histidinol phosphatase-like enzyme (inositol monophosphatase family)